MAVDDVIDVLVILAPEYAATPTLTLGTWIGFAEDELSADRWAAAEVTDAVTVDAYYNRAAALLAAHLMTISVRGAATASAATDETVGDVSVRFASAGPDAGVTDSTGYGQQFKAFRRSIFPSAEAV